MTKPITERKTRQKQAIRDVFAYAERPLSVEEVHIAAQGLNDRVSVPTVYRSIRSLLAEGWLSIVELPGRSPVYETASREHHHHFICDACARVFELEGCNAVQTSLPSGFSARCHEVTINGLCADCHPMHQRESD